MNRVHNVLWPILSVAAIASGCVSEVSTTDGDKAAAADLARVSKADSADICPDAWYGDGECDWFCQDDPDCGWLDDPADPVCVDAGPTEAAGFEHLRTRITLAAGDAVHSMSEAVVTPGADLVLRGKFAYGFISKDLEDEAVLAYMRAGDCGEWTFLGEATTNDDGEVSFEVAPIETPGVYQVQLVVAGDLTRAAGQITVLDPGGELVVFDVDGTLTTSDGELFEEIFAGVDAEAFESSPEVVNAYAAAGYTVVYVTGRPHFLQAHTHRWLQSHGYPAGPLFTSSSLLEAGPPGVEEHKVRALTALTEAGFGIFRAFGNASTDVCAYARVGVDPAQTFIIGANGGTACDGYAPTQDLVSYTAHLETLSR